MQETYQLEPQTQNSVMQRLLSDEFTGKLEALAADKATAYKSAKPFPHIYFDDFLPADVAEAALRDFPDPKEVDWLRHRGVDQHRKLAFDQAEKLPPVLRDILFFLNTRPMLQFLETLTGIEAVFGDPYYNGGGLHQIRPGGSLEVHADYSFHPKLKVDRRINVLIYLNKDWKEEYGGHFELWNRDLTQAEQRILPVFNRCAIFSTTSHSYHGHPQPLACPPDRTRKSIATYYFTSGQPLDEETHAHPVAFVRRPGTKEPASFRIKKALHSLTPPLFVDLYRRLRR